jgi:hypothetical protein
MRSTPRERTIRLIRPTTPEEAGTFCIQQGKEATYYVFREIHCAIGGRGFAVHRLGLGDLYHVRIGEPADCSCECLGFLAHGKCRHVLGLLTLAEHSLLAT